MPAAHHLILAALTAGCLQVPEAAAPACATSVDCPLAGQVCDEGVCWGGAALPTLAARLVAPRDRTDVVATEVAPLSIGATGWIEGLTLAAPVDISGRVEAYCATGACDGGSLGATVTVTHASAFAGGPAFRAVTTATAGASARTDSFALHVPPLPAGDAYTVTVVPDGRGDGPPADGSQAPAELAPPRRLTLAALADLPNTRIVLGGPAAPTVHGSLSDGTRALTQYRVVALGHWEADAPLTEVSTIAYTTTGAFTLTLADGLVGPVELVARPYGANVVAPALIAPRVAAGDDRALVQPDVGNRVAAAIRIEGLAASGSVEPVAGARVLVAASYQPDAFAPFARAELALDTTTGADGVAHVTLLDGPAFAGAYQLSVIPPAGSTLAAIYARPLTPGDTTPVRLPARARVHGRVVDSDGNPMSNVAVTARPSQRFAWTMPPAAQQFLAAIPAQTAVTPATGEFVVWVDGSIAGAWGRYDLELEPALGSFAPDGLVADVALPRVPAASVALDPVRLPAAVRVHGRVLNLGATPVAGAELRVFAPTTDTSLCGQVLFPPAQCVIPARVVGHGTSDELGLVRLLLPQP